MKHYRVTNIAGRFYQDLSRCSRAMLVDFEKEAIHNFRVEYKKMRAFIRLMNDDAGSNKIEIPKKLHQVFSLAGALRDNQLQRVSVRETAKSLLLPLPGYYYVLGHETGELQTRLAELVNTSPPGQYQKSPAFSNHHNFHLKPFPFYLRGRCASVQKILQQVPLTDEMIHEIRKILKDLYYNLEIYRLLNAFPPGTWKEKVAGYFNPLLEQLGRYQDKCTGIALLETYWLKHLDTSDREPLVAIRAEWEKEITPARQLLIKKLHSDPVLVTGDSRSIPLIVDTAI